MDSIIAAWETDHPGQDWREHEVRIRQRMDAKLAHLQEVKVYWLSAVNATDFYHISMERLRGYIHKGIIPTRALSAGSYQHRPRVEVHCSDDVRQRLSRGPRWGQSAAA